MLALVITGSRSDRNGLLVVAEALMKAGHDVRLVEEMDHGSFMDPDVAIVGGDRIEILEAAVWCAQSGIPIAHIAGGDVTLGSIDDRYRDAITALSCIHFATNELAHLRLTNHLVRHPDDRVYLTGSPAIDAIKQTKTWDKQETFYRAGIDHISEQLALVCVHPNTLSHVPAEFDYLSVRAALNDMDINWVWIGANADVGGDSINRLVLGQVAPGRRQFFESVHPEFYYSLMQHCDVMIGNSSAMLYEAPCFDLPCVLVGSRQNGRTIPANVTPAGDHPDDIATAIKFAVEAGLASHSIENPYGDGESAPRIVKALEDNAWRWQSETSEVLHGKQS